MDKQVVEYLDKIGCSLQDYGKTGFETYTNGVFVESLIMTGIGLLLILIAILITIQSYKDIKYGYINNVTTLFYNPKDNECVDDVFVVMGVCVITFIFGSLFLISNITGVFAPDYVALKEIIEGIR